MGALKDQEQPEIPAPAEQLLAQFSSPFDVIYHGEDLPAIPPRPLLKHLIPMAFLVLGVARGKTAVPRLPANRLLCSGFRIWNWTEAALTLRCLPMTMP